MSLKVSGFMRVLNGSLLATLVPLQSESGTETLRHGPTNSDLISGGEVKRPNYHFSWLNQVMKAEQSFLSG